MDPLNQSASTLMATATGPTGHPESYHRLFCYGTLQIPEVLEAVIGHPLRGIRAVLPGYAAYQVRRAEYPGLVRSPGNKTSGRLYRDVSLMELNVLDRFEGRLYRRQPHIILKNSGQRIQAWVYMVAPGRQKQVTAKPWHLDRFLRTGYQRFMRRFVMDRRVLYARENL
jgi:gamma-glutamylcyclotransferase (GGCT)/AIG2-like uncharacterized protein YtfP